MRKLFTVDCDYVFKRFAASYVIEDGGRFAIVESNTAHAIPKILDAITDRSKVDYLIITHVHLDHAGGAWKLMQECRNAVLLCHPRTKKHLIDPSKLIRAAQEVYGIKVFEELYGRIEPIPSDRIRDINDGESVSWGSSKPWTFYHTKGHANHHLVMADPDLNGVFTGDSLGLSYPDKMANPLWLIPSTSPSDFEVTSALASADLIANLGLKYAFLTHFGEITLDPNLIKTFKDALHFSGSLQDRVERGAWGSVEDLESELRSYYQKRHGDAFVQASELLKMDIHLNAQGILAAAKKALEKKTQS